ncbi:Fic-domain-containing protein [Hypoxylon trugodes]|uniref:Fic-domain-containing protein n=1 Tax=Hypoxylon trugodes TaxID=326681 RepID=UPI0021933C00|nr:Fic-domain-containing protein [Hypoxylon trugodes]KAI1393352.1 Fic-domain-containing protein [Hypoxylon trugodes]
MSRGTPYKKLQNDLIDFIHGSNYIEFCGSDFTVTEKLCRRVFRGENIPANVEARSLESHQEIINHAQALNYAVGRIVLDGDQVTEELIKNIHKRLCSGDVLGEDGGYPGQYRTWEIAARHGQDMKKKSVFIRASAVPQYMADLIHDLRNDMMDAEESRAIDPFDMANKYCHRLVCIHPFGDGNGRMCRILLNILLLKYTGRISIFGGTDDEREEYLGIARRANKRFHEEDMEVPEEEKIGHRELAKYTLGKLK